MFQSVFVHFTKLSDVTLCDKGVYEVWYASNDQ